MKGLECVLKMPEIQIRRLCVSETENNEHDFGIKGSDIKNSVTAYTKL